MADPPRQFAKDRLWDRFASDEVRKVRQYYYGLVTHLDFELGRLLDAVENSADRENTIVALTCDHGCMLGEHGQYVKGPHYYTETARVPLILSFPGRLPPGRRVSGLVEMVDFLPTLCDLCGLSIPARAAGRSMLPVITGSAPARSEVYAEQHWPGYGESWQAVRTERYSYTRYHSGEGALFDLNEDPFERRNLVRDAEATLVRDLEARMEMRAMV